MGDSDYLRAGALRAALDGLPDDMLVVLAKDSEGNRYSPLADAELGRSYQPDTTWSGELVTEGGEVCVLLWPTN